MGKPDLIIGLRKKIFDFAKKNLGKMVGNGQCFDLADKAMKEAKAKRAKDYGQSYYYVWGKKIAIANIKPGDILQFKNYRYDKKITTLFEDKSGGFMSTYQTRPHHTAIVAAKKTNDILDIYEQNVVPEGKKVQLNTIYSKSYSSSVKVKMKHSSGAQKEATVTTTIKVGGSILAYQAVLKKI